MNHPMTCGLQSACMFLVNNDDWDIPQLSTQESCIFPVAKQHNPDLVVSVCDCPAEKFHNDAFKILVLQYHSKLPST